MMGIILRILGAGFLASIVWFVVGGFLYMNPFVSKIYRKFKNSKGVKVWNSTRQYLFFMYLFILIQCIFFSFAYFLIRASLFGALWKNVFIFGFLLVVIKIVPRWLDMWIQSDYPNELLLIEVINGTIGSFVIAFVLAYVLG